MVDHVLPNGAKCPFNQRMKSLPADKAGLFLIFLNNLGNNRIRNIKIRKWKGFQNKLTLPPKFDF